MISVTGRSLQPIERKPEVTLNLMAEQIDLPKHVLCIVAAILCGQFEEPNGIRYALVRFIRQINFCGKNSGIGIFPLYRRFQIQQRRIDILRKKFSAVEKFTVLILCRGEFFLRREKQTLQCGRDILRQKASVQICFSKNVCGVTVALPV